MIKTTPLSEDHERGLEKINTWLDTFPKSKEVFFLGRMRDIGYLQAAIIKVLNIKQYTEDERNIFNDLRKRYYDKNIEDDLPF